MEVIMSALAALAANAPYLIGFILPPFVQFLNKDVPEHGRSKFIVTGLVCIGIAIVYNWRAIFQETDWASIEATLATFSLILAQSEVAYRLYFKNSALQQRMVVRLSARSEPAAAPQVPTQ